MKRQEFLTAAASTAVPRAAGAEPGDAVNDD